MKNLFSFVFLSTFLISVQAQFQKGNDVDGNRNNEGFGGAVSMPDKQTLAVGAPLNDSITASSGRVQVYRWSKTAWKKKGAGINGVTRLASFGSAVHMPDSNTLAVSARMPNRVQVYRWVDTAWVEKGNTILGPANKTDKFGFSVCMPDSNTIAIGAPDKESNSLKKVGAVHVYSWNGSAWIKKGNTIEDWNRYHLGYSISMPDQNTIAIGAPYSAGGSSAVNVYNWTGSKWNQVGSRIIDHPAWNYATANFGISVSMPSKNVLAIGATNGITPQVDTGYAYVYHLQNNQWIQRGKRFKGEAGQTQFGCSVAMPDTNTVAIGAKYNGVNGYRSGSVKVYRWNNSNWTSFGNSILGKAQSDQSGSSISMPTASTIAIGAPAWNSTSGHVRVYEMCKITPYETTVDTCTSYTWPSTGITYNHSGVYKTSFTTPLGCDSSAILNLTINKGDSTNQFVETCKKEYFWPVNRVNYNKSGSYSERFTNINGCDSILTLNLLIDTVHASIERDSASNVLRSKQQHSKNTYQWYFCNNDTDLVAINGATGPTFRMLASASYALEVKRDSCVELSNCKKYQTIKTTFINKNNLKDAVRIYPNPNNGNFKIEVNTHTHVNLKLYNTQGLLVMSLELQGGIQEIKENLPTGLYYLKLSNKYSVVSKSIVIK